MKLDIQLFGGRGAISSGNSKTFEKNLNGNRIRYKVTKDSKGLYSYQSQEYSAINKKWVNMSKQKNFTKEAIENWLDIKVRF